MRIVNRELSWLCFNDRVLQEALDSKVPLIERMRFLGIYSNNMDEFYRVRVANLQRIFHLKKKNIAGFNGNAEDLYKEIRKTVNKQQEKVELAYQQIVSELENDDIFHLSDKHLTKNQDDILSDFFHKELKHAIFPIILNKKNAFPRLRDYSIYLAVKISTKGKSNKYSLIEIPRVLSRFFLLKEGDKQFFILIDDVIRIHLDEIFSIFINSKIEAFTFKFTRDADLDLDDDISTSFFDKIEKGLKQRKKGSPVRFVYDEKMPKDLLDYLLDALELKKGVNTIPGGKYHNFKDFIGFPDFGKQNLIFQKQIPSKHFQLEKTHSLIETILKEDVLLYFPYQRFDYVVDLLREAAIDPFVKEININIYRVTKESQIMNALLAAIFNGKEVTVVMELQARFDEENNLYWSNRLRENGAKVIHGVPNLKVHSKLLQIKRIEDKKIDYISYVGTGNFNEKTSKIYTDFGLLTSNPTISIEINKVFRLLENNLDRGQFRHLIVSPINTRRKIIKWIDQEIINAKKGLSSGIKLKLNNLTDEVMIEKLYAASNAGVKIELIIRGICCLIPGVKGMSENITAISIVDRYLEHARLMVFENAGEPLIFILSADFMERNLDYRIEVGVPILDKKIQAEILQVFDFQWRGSVKSRLLSKDFKNEYRKNDLPPFHAQLETYKYYADLS